MAKRDFMQTPEQRDRANYYSKKRKRQVSDLPLIQEQMVEEQFIETPEVVEQEPVFEYATPNMPSPSELAVTFDTGTAGIWANVIDNITGSIMSVTQDAFKFNAERKKQKRRLTLEEYSASPAEYDAVAEEINQADILRKNGETVPQINIPQAMLEQKNRGAVELSKQIYIQNNGSQELQSSIQEELLARGIEEPFDNLSGQQQLDIMETIFIQSDSLFFGEAVRQDRQQQWLDIIATVDQKNFGKMTESLVEYRDQLEQINLNEIGLSNEAFVSQQLNDVLAQSQLNLDIVKQVVGEDFTRLEELTTSNGVKVFDIQSDEQGNVTSIGFNGSPETFMGDENTRYVSSAIIAQQLRDRFPSNNIEFLPEQVTQGLRAVAQGDDSDPFAIASVIFLSSFNNDSIDGLISRNREIGGIGLETTDQQRLMTLVSLYKYMGTDEPGKTRDIELTLNTFNDIWNRDTFNAAYSSLYNASRTDQSTISVRNEIIDSFRTRMGLDDDEYDPLAYDFNVEDNPSLASLMVLLHQVDKRQNLPETVRTNLKNNIYNNAKVVPILRDIDVDGDGTSDGLKLVDVQLRNKVDYAIYQQGVRTFDERINFEFSAGQQNRSDIEDSVPIVLDNLSPNTYRGFERDELERAMIAALEKTRQKEMNYLRMQGKKPRADYKISPQGFNETILLMTPSVQNDLFELVDPKNQVNSIENLLANFDELVGGRQVTDIRYANSSDISRRQRNNANYGASAFGYGVSTIVYRGEEIDVQDSFASRSRSGMVFPSVYSELYIDKNGDVVEGSLPRLPKESQQGFLSWLFGQTASAIEFAEEVIDDPTGLVFDKVRPGGPDAPDIRYTDPTTYVPEDLNTFEMAIYEWVTWTQDKIEKVEAVSNQLYPILVDTIDKFISTSESRLRTVASISPEPIKDAINQTLDNLPNQVDQVEREIAHDLGIGIVQGYMKLRKAPGMVVDAAIEELPKVLTAPEQIKEAVIKSYKNTLKYFSRASQSERILTIEEEIDNSPEFSQHLQTKIGKQESLVSEEQIITMDRRVILSSDELEPKEKNRQEQKEYRQFEYYVSEKLKRADLLSLEEKVKLNEAVETRAKFMALYNRVKNTQQEQPTYLDLYENLLEMRSLTLMENN